MSAPVILGKFAIAEKVGPVGEPGADVEIIPITPGYDMRATVDDVAHSEDTIAVSFSVTVTPHAKPHSGRGLASLSVGRRRAIASKAGASAHKAGTAHEFTSEEARASGRKGGRAVSADRAHMAQIGAKGGKARSKRHSDCEPGQPPTQAQLDHSDPGSRP